MRPKLVDLEVVGVTHEISVSFFVREQDDGLGGTVKAVHEDAEENGSVYGCGACGASGWAPHCDVPPFYLTDHEGWTNWVETRWRYETARIGEAS